MLVSFSISNFRSFGESQLFSLIASDDQSHLGHVYTSPKLPFSVLRTGVLYGANGAGKSNLLKAIRFFKDMCIRKNSSSVISRMSGFCFNSEHHPTTMDLVFCTRERAFRIGFSVKEGGVFEEWFSIIDENGEERKIFERGPAIENGLIYFHDETRTKIIDAATLIGAPSDQMFMNYVFSSIQPKDWPDVFRDVAAWLTRSLIIIGPEQQYAGLAEEISDDDSFRQFISDFLRDSSTGVSDIQMRSVPVDQDALRRMIPIKNPESLFDVGEDQKDQGFKVQVPGREEVTFHKGEDGTIFQKVLEAVHVRGEQNAVLNINEESDGTRRLMNLLPSLFYAGRNDFVFLVDEIDRSLHPNLVKAFMRFYLGNCAGGAKQLIVTTHESSLLDLDLLRRDEIWFAEKGPSQETKIYSMHEYPVRADIDARAEYIRGRYGAIPFLGRLELLCGDAEGLGVD